MSRQIAARFPDEGLPGPVFAVSGEARIAVTFSFE
jgi:hypothetical protein